MSVFLGIDVGTSGTKTLAIDQRGRILAEATSSYVCYHPKPLWSEQSPDAWWQATITTVRQVMAKASLKPFDVKAIGLSGQMHGSVFLDKRGEIIRPAILWNDQRTQNECWEIEKAAGSRAKLIEMVANPALTGFTLPKVLWLRENEPENFAKLHKLLLPKDEIRRRLTGELATDVCDASGTLAFDVVHRRWCQPLIDKLHLDASILPQAFECDQVTGKLTSSAAEQLGLTTDCLVVAGAGDNAAGGIGNGIVQPGEVSTSIGTSGVIFAYLDKPVIDPEGRVHTICHAVPGKWYMAGVNLSSGACLQWFGDELCQANGNSNGNLFSVLTKEAEPIPSGAEGLFFLPYLAGERTPHADPDARGCFVGLTLSHKRGHMVRAIMEGVTYALRESLEIMRALNIPITEIRASGGGAQSQLWRQIQSDMFGLPVKTLNAEQGPAYGVALLAAVGFGAFSSIQEASAETIKVVQETPVNHESSNYYNRAFPLYRDLYKSLKADFKSISALAKV